MTRADLDYLINGIVSGINGGSAGTGGFRGGVRGGVRGARTIDDDEVDEIYKKYIEDISKIEERRLEKKKGETRRYLDSQNKIKENDEIILDLQERLNNSIDRRNELLEKRDDGTITEDEKEELQELIKEWDEYNKRVEENTRLKEENSNTSLVGSIGKDITTVIDSFRKIKQEIEDFIKPWVKIDAAASKYAKTLGLTKQGMDNLAKNSLDNLLSKDLAAKYDISTEELLEAQENYVKASGRHIRVDFDDQDTIAAFKSMNGNGLELASLYDNFGVSLEETGNRVGKMFADASKQGISFEKYSDNVAKNIKIAQNYTFKNGLKGLESMAKKATAMKMDMQQVAQLADKVSSVEGAIDVAAQLQVLGGPFAHFADPLGMLNEGLTDMEGLQDRLLKMIAPLGSFNKETGEVNFSGYNRKRIKAAADAMGVSYDSLMTSASAQARREEIKKQIAASQVASGFDNDLKELIMNSGTIKNGKAGVSINGTFKTLEEISSDDKNSIITESRSDSDNIKDIAYNLRSIEQEISGASKAKDAKNAQMARKIADWYGQMLHFSAMIEPLLAAIVIIQGIVAAIEIAVGVGKVIDIFRGGRGGRVKGSANRRGGTNKPKSTSRGKGNSNTPKNTSSGKGNSSKSKNTSSGKGNSSKSKNTSSGKGNSSKPKNTSSGKGNSSKSKSTSSGTGNSGAKGSTVKPPIPTETTANGGGGTTTSSGGKKPSTTPEVKPEDVAGRVARKKVVDTAKKKAAKEVGEGAATKMATKGVTKLGSKLTTGVATGGIGLIGAGADMGLDYLSETGKIEKGGVAHVGGKTLAGAAEFGALGASLGGPIGAVVGAAFGGLKGLLNGLGVFDGPKGPLPTYKRPLGIAPVDNTYVARPPVPPPLSLPSNKESYVPSTPEELVNKKYYKNINKIEEDILGGPKITPKPDTLGIDEATRIRLNRVKEERQKDIQIKPTPHEIELNGTLKLQGENGKSVDMISELRKNPQMMRELAGMISNEMDVLQKGTTIGRRA